MAGRPTKLTDELIDTLCENIELGMPYTMACDASGINYSTFKEWMSKGEEEVPKKQFMAFSARVKAANSECARRCLEHIREKADNGSTFYDTWLLERRFSEHFGAKQHITSDNKTKTENENINVDVKPSEEIEQEILSKLSRLASRT